MFNIDISPLGKLATEANKKSFGEFKIYIGKVLEYVEDKVGPIKFTNLEKSKNER